MQYLWLWCIQSKPYSRLRAPKFKEGTITIHERDTHRQVDLNFWSLISMKNEPRYRPRQPQSPLKSVILVKYFPIRIKYQSRRHFKNYRSFNNFFRENGWVATHSSLLMNRIRCNKKDLTYNSKIKVNFTRTSFFTNLQRPEGVELRYSGFYTYFFYTLYKYARARCQTVWILFLYQSYVL